MDSNELLKQFANGLVLVATAPNKKAKLKAAQIVQELSYSIALSDIFVNNRGVTAISWECG